jgi:hypothetical protein
MADRILWNVRCSARRTSGLPCKSWSIRGADVCRVHGGSAPQVREQARYRLARLPGDLRFLADVQRVLGQFAAASPAQLQADGKQALAEIRAERGLPAPRT